MLNGFGFLPNYGVYENTPKLSEPAKDILDRIQNGEETKEGKGVIVVRGKPSNNKATYCVSNLRGGSTVAFKRDAFAAALSELIDAGLIFELDQEQNQTRFKLNRIISESASSKRTATLTK